MTACTNPTCRRRDAALHQLVDVLQPDRDQRDAYVALDAAIAAEAALVDPDPEPDTIRCRRCGQDKPATDYSMTGAGRKKLLDGGAVAGRAGAWPAPPASAPAASTPPPARP